MTKLNTETLFENVQAKMFTFGEKIVSISFKSVQNTSMWRVRKSPNIQRPLERQNSQIIRMPIVPPPKKRVSKRKRVGSNEFIRLTYYTHIQPECAASERN